MIQAEGHGLQALWNDVKGVWKPIVGSILSFQAEFLKFILKFYI